MQFQYSDHSSMLGSSSILEKIIYLINFTARNLTNLCPYIQNLIFITELLDDNV